MFASYAPRRQSYARSRRQQARCPARFRAQPEPGKEIRPWTEDIVRAADVVITLGCGDDCPLFPGKCDEDWVLDDPAGQDLDAVRPICDEIGQRVHSLLTSLGVAPDQS